MRRQRKATHEEVEFQLTPMIDMTFLLLIFFMVTSKLSDEQDKKEIRLPTASTAVLPEKAGDRDVINIDEKGDYYVANKKMSKEELAAYLRERFKYAPPLKVHVRADKNTPSKKIKEVLSLGGQAGASQFIFGTYKN